MPAAVICFERFRVARDRQRSADGSVPTANAPFLRQPGVALSARQIAHRRAMLDYGSERERVRFTVAATEPE